MFHDGSRNTEKLFATVDFDDEVPLIVKIGIFCSILLTRKVDRCAMTHCFRSRCE